MKCVSKNSLAAWINNNHSEYILNAAEESIESI